MIIVVSYYPIYSNTRQGPLSLRFLFPLLDIDLSNSVIIDDPKPPASTS